MGPILRPAAFAAVLVACLASVRPALAAVLEMGGTLELRIAGLPPISFSQDPPTLMVSVSSGGGAFDVPAGLFSGFAPLPTPLFTGVPLITSLNVVSAVNRSGSFAPGVGSGGGFGGIQGFDGRIHFGILGLSTANVLLDPIGQGGTNAIVVASLSVTLVGNAFTTGPGIVTGISTELTRATPSDTVGCAPVVCGPGFGGLGVFVNTVTLSGADNRTPGHAGTLALVSPIRLVGNAFGPLPGYAVERFTFVPEPGTLVLFASTAAAALAWGATRRRSR
jgi:hypothetical protein